MKNIILRVLFAVLIFSIAGCKGPGRTAQLPQPPMLGEMAKLKLKKAIETRQHRQEKETQQFKEDLEILKKRNPFIPSAVASVGPRALELKGIIWEEKNPTAIINDMIVSEGDMVGNKRVKKITKNSVILIEGEKEHILELKF